MTDYFFGLTDKGLKRTNNEDCFIAQNIAGGNQVLACVIDGVGGYEGGEMASAIAQETILQLITQEVSEPIETLKQTLISANEKIFIAKDKNIEQDKMACVLTLVIADPGKNKFYYAHVGDTRLYLLRDKTLVKISRDHSTVGFLEESGRLTEDEAMRHPRRNEITKALGFQSQIDAQSDFIESSESPFLPGDTLLLCSDGLTDMINHEGISAILNSSASLQEKGMTLVKGANAAGGHDNITVVIVQNNNKSQPLEATKPQQKKNNIPPEKTQLSINTATAITPVKKNKITPFLFIIILGLAALSAWLFYNKNNSPVINQEVETLVKSRTTSELAFASLIQDTSAGKKGIVTLPAAQNIMLTESILFTQDSVTINASSATFIADSSFTGPAFIFSPQCQFISINNANFKNFNIAIQINRQDIQFSKVSFPGCSTSVQQNIILNDSINTGHIPGILFLRTDSIYIHP